LKHGNLTPTKILIKITNSKIIRKKE